MSKDNQALDVTSDKFDPLLAIYSNIIPDPKAKPFDNMNVIEAQIKRIGNIEMKIVKSIKSKQLRQEPSASTSSVEMPERRFLPHQMPISSTKIRKVGPNVITNMEKSTGPLYKLNEFKTQRQKIKVTIRNTNGIRGYVTGYLEAFDNQWNLALSDVTECWKRRKLKYTKLNGTFIGREPEDMTERLKELRIKLPKVNVKNAKGKNVECSRHLPVLLVRGEMVGVITLDKIVEN